MGHIGHLLFILAPVNDRKASTQQAARLKPYSEKLSILRPQKSRSVLYAVFGGCTIRDQGSWGSRFVKQSMFQLLIRSDVRFIRMCHFCFWASGVGGKYMLVAQLRKKMSVLLLAVSWWSMCKKCHSDLGELQWFIKSAEQAEEEFMEPNPESIIMVTLWVLLVKCKLRESLKKWSCASTVDCEPWDGLHRRSLWFVFACELKIVCENTLQLAWCVQPVGWCINPS